MDPKGRYKVDAVKIAFEMFENEVIIVNLESGCYYSANKTGLEVFSSLASGSPVDEVLEQLSRWPEAPAGEIRAQGERFVSELLDEGILIPRTEGPAGPVPATASRSAASGPYEPPGLLKYSDMKDLLLLDVIHDVDEKGWPVAKN